MSNIYTGAKKGKKSTKKPQTANKKEELESTSEQHNEGKVLFMINVNLGLKKILVKFREDSNPIQLARRIAHKESLSDDKREEVYLLILNRVNNFRQLIGERHDSAHKPDNLLR